MVENGKSKIFTGFRALGYVSNHVPLATRYHPGHRENYVVTCVGKAFHTYKCSTLGIKSVSDGHPDQINCLAVSKALVFTACQNVVRAFLRGKQVIHTYTGHDHPVHLLLPFADHLISVDEGNHVKVWDIKSEVEYLTLEFENASFTVSAAVHPSTYLNKVIFGSRQGALQLWNIRTNNLIFTFQGWGCAVTVLEQAPAIDVIAVGLSSGRIVLHNMRYDETVVSFLQEWGPVTAVTFRTDGPAIMATGSAVGHIALWNLEERKLQSQIRDAHGGAVTGLKSLPNEPLLITSSNDNSLKVWVLDQPDGGGRLLRHRMGHSAPPSRVRFHGTNGKTILSAGQDSTLQTFSTVHDSHSRSLGRASYFKKKSKKSSLREDKYMMPPITDFASETARESDWDNVVACHHGEMVATTWSTHRFCMGKHKLLPPRLEQAKHQDKQQFHKKTTAVCGCLTSCGNYAIVGYSSGHMDLFNMQSGLHRGQYGKDTAHIGAVRGVAVDSLNQLVVSGGADCHLRFWHFKEHSLLTTLKVDAQISKIHLHRESCMLAVILDDFDLIIIDLDTRGIIRQFDGHTNSITDVAFSSDGRRLVSSSMDCTVRTWDIPTGRLVDCFLVDEAVTSLAFSPTNDFLATSHVDDLGIYLWSNITLYKHVALKPLPSNYQPQLIEMPTTAMLSEGLIEDVPPSSKSEVDDDILEEFSSPDQLADSLVTLSLLPHSRWHSLLHLDVIRARNKPKAPPKVPKAAPFFLPTLPGLTPVFVSPDEGSKDETGSQVSTGQLQPLTPFVKLLKSTQNSADFDRVLDQLKEMGPSGVDTEIRSLSPDGGGDIQLMAQFIKFTYVILQTNRDFELVQSYLALFLKVHGELLSEESELVDALRQLQTLQTDSWQQIQHMFSKTLCLTNYLRSATL